MTRHGPPTFALAALLLVVLAGMVVMLPAAGAAPADASRLVALDDPAGGSAASLAAPSGGAKVADQQGLYEELTTAVSTGSGQSVSRQVDDEADLEPDPGSDDSTDGEHRLHRWRCPICDATKLSFGSTPVDPSEAAANNLRSHIRNTDGEGHGPLGTVPEWITQRELEDDVAVLALAD
jgi:hypothetical protein